MMFVVSPSFVIASEAKQSMDLRHGLPRRLRLLASDGALPVADSKAKAEGAIKAWQILDSYLTNRIARSSAVMQQCSAERLRREELAEAEE